MLKDNEFVHLHNHTDFSMLDGASRIKNLVKKVANIGQNAVAITDHGVLHGAYYLWKECQKHNSSEEVKQNPNLSIKPIIGVEAYVTPGTSRHDNTRRYFGGPYSPEDREKARDDVSARGTYTHMTIWAENNQGLFNLNWMQSKASIDRTIANWARIDRELMSQYSKGLLATTGCPSGAVQTYLRLGMYKEAVREAAELQDIFGKDNFWVELMDHGIEFEKRTRQDLLKLAKEIGAPLLATNDLHYVEKEDAIAQDAMLCINSGKTLNDPNRFKFDGSGYYVKTTAEMFELFSEIPEAMTNTLEIAQRCNIDYIEEQGRFMPHVPFPQNDDSQLEEQVKSAIIIGRTQKIQRAKNDPNYQLTTKESTDVNNIASDVVNEGAFFIDQVMKGLNERFDNNIPKEHLDQAKFELDTIISMGFPSYFLVVADLVQWAKANNIFVGPGRGSAAGSIVAYALKITDLDPLEHKLVFERFLNPERISLPDIDIDFEEGGRDKVIQYCSQKYGDDNVAQIVTYGIIKPKNAIRDSARILGYEYSVGDLLSKEFGNINNQSITLNQIVKSPESTPEAQQFREFSKTNEIYQEVVNMATNIEGLVRQTGVHASGVLVSNEKIANICPTMRRAADNAIITQFEAHGCEELGFVKMDFLGLKNLNTNKAALANIKKVHNIDIDLLKIPLDDPKTFEIIASANTLGVFQLDSDGMRTLLKRMKPKTFNDISATLALFRPGPMGVNAHNDFADRKNGRKKIEPIHPEVDEALKDILGDTYGLVVFQEQIQFAARKLAGFSLGAADVLRRAMGKKNIEDLMKAKADFEPGMKENGYSQEAIDAVWNVFQPFAEYAFNRAHTACYAFNAYTNAYLKANYPIEFMAALLTTFGGSHDRLSIYLSECKRMGIEVEVPSVNKSNIDFSPDGNKILFGLGSIRNVGEGTAYEIIKARESKGDFEDFNDFLKKVPDSVCNKRKIESLIKAGAFDEFGFTRKGLLLVHEDAVDAVLPVKRKEAEGQFDLFGALDIETEDAQEALSIKVPDVDEWDKKTKLNFEKEMLGLYVSDHPLSKLSSILVNKSDINLSDLNSTEVMQNYDNIAKTPDPKNPKRSSRPTVNVAGIIKSVSRRLTKANKPYIKLELEDLSGAGELVIWGNSSAYEKNNAQLREDQIIIAKCNIKIDGDIEDGFTGSLSANEINILDLSLDSEIPDVILVAKAEFLRSKQNAQDLMDIISKYPGQSPVVIRYEDKGKIKNVSIPANFCVEPNSAFISEIKALGLKYGSKL